MGRGKSVFASKNLWFKSNGSSNGVRKDEAAAAKREQQRSNDSGEVAVEVLRPPTTGSTTTTSSRKRENDDEGCTAGCSPTPAVSKTDSRPRLAGGGGGEGAAEWYAERDINRRASEFIDRVHRGMLADTGERTVLIDKLTQWYAERDIDRKASEFINRYTEGCSPAHYDDNNYYGR
ncbi:hypothetical protein [Oryza sativa Japonica Group]|uniref:Uncharacterized protein n=1 Tax=Oryza sativa subsp. japonica TaxID=39947 RepID=Q5NBG1_ORYSJ|nr:hypothetical protein [Oryza sativa Japonica Group]